MSLRKIKRLYNEKKAEINATMNTDYPAFIKWLTVNHPQLYAETLEANKRNKKPVKLLAKVMKEYLKWKSSGGK